MKGQNTDGRMHKLVAGVAIAGIALAILFSKVDGVAAQGWNHFDGSAWAVLDVLRAVILAAWQLVPSYLREEARCLGHLLQIVACTWQLLFVIAG
jgi:hypothetical protein